MKNKEKQKIGYRWNKDVYCDRTYIAPCGKKYSLEHLRTTTHNYKFKYRDDEGKRQKGNIDVEVRYDTHCFTSKRKDGDTTPALSFDDFNDGSNIERVFDLQRYENSHILVQTIKHLTRKNCKESRITGKALYFKQQDKRRPRYGLYVILKIRNESGKLVMFVETAHTRPNTPPKLDLSDREETYDIILGRLIKKEWPELIK